MGSWIILVMVTMTLKCHHCGSEKLVRDGRTPKGKQRYWCRECDRSSCENPQPSGYPEQEKEIILNAYEERSSRRALARVFLFEFPFSKISDYFNFAPFGTSSKKPANMGRPSSPIEAAKIMPCDSSPRSFLGARLATTMTLRPMRFSGS